MFARASNTSRTQNICLHNTFPFRETTQHRSTRNNFGRRILRGKWRDGVDGGRNAEQVTCAKRAFQTATPTRHPQKRKAKVFGTFPKKYKKNQPEVEGAHMTCGLEKPTRGSKGRVLYKRYGAICTKTKKRRVTFL